MIGLAFAAGVCAGCRQQYVSSPGVPTARGIPENPNKPAAADCMVLAVQYVAGRYPPGSLRLDAGSAAEQRDARVPYECVVNLPRGLRRSFYERIAREIGPACRPMSVDVQHTGLPTFHVTRVWMRFSTATVDVVRAMPELGPGPDGKAVTQTVTVRLEGGTEPWHIVHARAGAPEEGIVPPPYFLPEEERVDQFEWQKRQDEAHPPGRGGY